MLSMLQHAAQWNLSALISKLNRENEHTCVASRFISSLLLTLSPFCGHNAADKFLFQRMGSPFVLVGFSTSPALSSRALLPCRAARAGGASLVSLHLPLLLSCLSRVSHFRFLFPGLTLSFACLAHPCAFACLRARPLSDCHRLGGHLPHLISFFPFTHEHHCFSSTFEQPCFSPIHEQQRQEAHSGRLQWGGDS